MRPLFLSIEGINSFSDVQSIDFSEFSADNIFCVCGPTGSGKTTILDCIILALYGDGDRGDKLSEYISLGRDKAEIIFRFSFENKTWEVRRAFTKKGAAKCYLSDLDENKIVADRPESVTSAVKDLIGLERNEFTQVVILEQGKFAKFLSARKADRSRTVSQLFSLERYDGLYNKFAKVYENYTNKADGVEKALAVFDNVSLEVLETKIADSARLDKEEKEARKLSDSAAKSLAEVSLEREKFVRCKKAGEEVEAAKGGLKALESKKEILEGKKARYAASAEAYNAAAELNAKAKARLKELEAFKGEKEYLDKRLQALETARANKKETEEKSEKIKSEAAALQKQTGASEGELFKKNYGIFKAAVDFSAAAHDVKDALIAFKNTLQLDLHKKSACRDNYVKFKAELAAAEAAYKTANEAYLNSDALLRSCEEAYVKAAAKSEEKTALRDKAANENSAAHLCSFLKPGDECPVCGGVFKNAKARINTDFEKIKADADIAQSILKKAQADREKASAAASGFGAALIGAEAETKRLKNEVSQAEAQFNSLLTYGLSLKADEYKAYILDADNALAITEEIIKLQKKSEDAENLKRSLEKDAVFQSENIKSVSAEIENIRKKLTVKNPDEEEAAARKIIAESQAVCDKYILDGKEMDKEQHDIEKEEAALNLKIEIFAEDAAKFISFSFDEGKEEKLKAEKAAADGRLSQAVLNKGAIEAEILRLKGDLVKKEKLEKELSYFRKKCDLAYEIQKLMRGNALLEYIEDEYIQQFTSDASDKLFELSNGKYRLEYFEEDKKADFWVVDYLRGGQKRKAKTLSGGETFLASMSLAMAISSRISLVKSYGFFFLDEGFGTLDENTIEVVADALYKLSKETLVGVVSHRSELVERIPARVRVVPSSEERGSVIRIENA